MFGIGRMLAHGQSWFQEQWHKACGYQAYPLVSEPGLLEFLQVYKASSGDGGAFQALGRAV